MSLQNLHGFLGCMRKLFGLLLHRRRIEWVVGFFVVGLERKVRREWFQSRGFSILPLHFKLQSVIINPEI